MATFHSGNGGKLSIVGTPNVDVNIFTWTMTKKSRLAETTHSGSAGWQNVKGCVKEASGTFKLPWDSTAIPDTDLGLDAGDEATAQFYCGDSGKFYQVPLTVEDVVPNVDNQTGIVTMDVSWKSNGVITDPVT